MVIKTTSSDVTLLQQGDDYKLGIDADGYVTFQLKNTTLTSKEEVTTVTAPATGLFGTDEYQPSQREVTVIGKVNDGKAHSIQAVRELNGMIKLYVDGSLSASAYDEDNLNENLSGGKVVLGDAAYKGYVADVKVIDTVLLTMMMHRQKLRTFQIGSTTARLSKRRSGQRKHAASRLLFRVQAVTVPQWMSLTTTKIHTGILTGLARIHVTEHIR